MINWLRPLLLMFYAPARGMSEVRDRAPLGAAALLALLAQLAYALFTRSLYLENSAFLRGRFALLSLAFQAASSLLILCIVFVPTVTLIANLFDRRGGFRLVLQQEFSPLAAGVLYSWAAANLLGIPLALLTNLTGVEAAYVVNSLNSAAQVQEWLRMPPEMLAQLNDPRFHAENLYRWIALILFGMWATLAVRAVFRITLLRAVGVLVLSSVVIFITSPIWGLLFSWVFASPFLLLLLFLVGRGYAAELTRGQKARAAFKQNLEAATLNPADASAHYNLGLIYQQRNELAEASRRFQRAIEIDPEEIDAHYQLGRIARAENRLSDAINHFSQVVERDQTHAQHEIWRETGATYVIAGQYADARDALERFLEHRQSDPEGLYLMGRALAGLGQRREAASSMRACIEAVKTAPAYKYRTEKRWLNEAQQFLRSQV